RIDLTAAKMGLSPWRHGKGTGPRFSANGSSAKHVFSPKNGPVPGWPVNSYTDSSRFVNYETSQPH
ncbi:MAG: hypothetical protein K8R46_00225, partial [Pirellulales bacterium]|nr:hypothetical protein [Pirellulales bacterium]